MEKEILKTYETQTPILILVIRSHLIMESYLNGIIIKKNKHQVY